MHVYSVALVCLAPAYLLPCLCAHASCHGCYRNWMPCSCPLEPPQRRYPTPYGGACPAPAQVGRLPPSRDQSAFAFCAQRCQHMPRLVCAVRHGPHHDLWSLGYHVWVTSCCSSSLLVG